MKSSVESLSSVEKKILVEIEPEKVQEAIESAYRQLARSVRLPGFRQGKVPRRILEQRYRTQVESEVAQSLVERSYPQAVQELKVEPVASPRVEEQGVKPGEPFRYQARVEVKPVIAPKDYTGLAIKRGKHQVAEADVDAELEKIRRNQAQLVPVLDRDVAQQGDHALIDFEATAGGKPFPGNKGEGIAVEVAEGEFVQGNVAAVEGMKVGGTKEIDYTFPADFRIAEVRSQTARIALHLKQLKKKELPALDDELAKDVGGGSTLAELREKLKKALLTQAKSEKERETRTGIVKGLVAKNPFDCPRAMIEGAVESMIRSGLERMAAQGINVRQVGLDFEKLRGEMLPKAEEEVRGALLLQAIADKEKIEVADADFEARLAQMAEENEVPLEKVQQAFRRAEVRDGLRRRLREEKTLAFLESKAAVEEA